MHSAKTQICLDLYPVKPEALLCTQWVAKNCYLHVKKSLIRMQTNSLVFPLGPFSMVLRHALFLERHALFLCAMLFSERSKPFFFIRTVLFLGVKSIFLCNSSHSQRFLSVLINTVACLRKKYASVYRQDSVHALDKVKLTSWSYRIHNDLI